MWATDFSQKKPYGAVAFLLRLNSIGKVSFSLSQSLSRGFTRRGGDKNVRNMGIAVHILHRDHQHLNIRRYYLSE